MKLSILSLIIFIHINVLSQKKDAFFSNFKVLNDVLIFDDFPIDTEGIKEIPYGLLSDVLVTDENEVYFNIQSEKYHKFYALGYLNLTKTQKGYLIYHKFQSLDGCCDETLSCAVFKDDKFDYLLSLGQKIEGLNSIQAMVFPNLFILGSIESSGNIKDYEYSDIGVDLDYVYEESYIQEYVDSKLFKSDFLKGKAFLKRQLNDYCFDKDFLLKDYELIPLINSIGLKKIKSLYSISKERELSFESYFVDYLKLKDKKSIVFILNKYTYASFNKVVDISYLIIDDNMKIIKTDRLAKMFLGKDNKIEELEECKIVFRKNKIILIKEYESISYNLK